MGIIGGAGLRGGRTTGATGGGAVTGAGGGGGGGGGPTKDSCMNNAICGIVSAAAADMLACLSARTRGSFPVAKNKLSSSFVVWRKVQCSRVQPEGF